jgi:hypothetical protein
MQEPLTQEHPVLTEDRALELQALLAGTPPAESSRGAALLRAKLCGGLRALKSDMAAFQAANPGCALEDFVRWYSPRDWIPAPAPPAPAPASAHASPASTPPLTPHASPDKAAAAAAARARAQGGRDAGPAGESWGGAARAPESPAAGRRGSGEAVQLEGGRLSERMTQPGNAWVQSWCSVVAVPAHKQRRLFEVEREAERALHDLAALPPGALLHQLLQCAFAAGFHSLHAAIDPDEVRSVGATMARVRHLLWCGEDLAAQLDPLAGGGAAVAPPDRRHLDEVVTALALAERQVSKATSVAAALGAGLPSIVDMLCTSGRAALASPAERDALVRLAARPPASDAPASDAPAADAPAAAAPRSPRGGTAEEWRGAAPGGGNGSKGTGGGEALGPPQVREYACEASGGRAGCSQQLFVRTASDLFRIAVTTAAPPP